MNVDKPRGSHLAAGIDGATGLPTMAGANRHDTAVSHHHIGHAAGSAAAIENLSPTNQDVVHDRFLLPRVIAMPWALR